ncbi:MAG: BatA domain-containing protein [Planctomycetes bacterium]|nr:BatA domain-containing protein [Planctomycetota bacterium]MCC7397466.1 BatA domain-containing protein [Planctomycetota bacterium]
MLALAFLNPALLWAVPLCAVPIVIHILNRRRFHRVPWAAMEFLLAAMKRNRKRLRMEQWLVLLLRTLAVLLLVFLVARPQLSGGLLGTRTHHVVLLDDSASMTQRSGSAAVFERAQDRVRALAEDLAQRHAGDTVTIVRTSRAQQPDLTTRVNPETARKVGEELAKMSVGDAATDLGTALRLTIERAHGVEEASRTEFYVVADRRAHDWVSEDGKPRPAVMAALQLLDPQKDHLTVLGGGGGPQQNLAVTDVRLVDRLVVAGVPATLAVDVQNFDLDPAPTSTVQVEVDGQSRVALTVPPLAPGERVAVPLTHTFQGGHHRIEAQLEAVETYPIDDRRVLALKVRDKSKVLLVDGQPDEEFGETFYLVAAMEMAESGIEPQVVSDTMLEETDLSPFDVVWLCNVQAPSAAVAARLEQYVAAGGGLTIACGSLVDAARYTELFWKDGKGLLPLPLGEIAGDSDRPERAALVARDHAICEGLAEIIDLLLGNVVMVKRWFSTVEDARHPASVVARVHDADGPPLLVSRPFGPGGGEVMLLTTTADAFWTNLPVTDLFVVLVNQMHRAGARRDDHAANNLLPDATFTLPLDPGVYRPDVTVRAVPGGDERTFTAAEPPPAGEAAPTNTARPLVLTLPMAELRHLGAFELDLLRHDGVVDRRVVARNVPIAESRLVGFGDTDFQRLYPDDLRQRVTFTRDDGITDDLHGEGETWPLLAAALLAGLLLESLLAWRFGRR